jgi:sirohydrochlorin ferrochelatase/(2Fe-2S) ferredoxin
MSPLGHSAAREATRAGVLIVGHGSRNPAANAELERCVADYRARHPELDVAYGYVELAQPTLDDALRALGERCARVVVLPLFLFASGHVKNDLPLALERVRALCPATRFIAAPALGVHPNLVALARTQLARALGGEQSREQQAKTALIVVGRGASDPDANGDFCKLVRLIGEGSAFSCVLPCFAGIAEPRLDATLELAARTRPERMLVLPYLLFAGRLIERLDASVRAFNTRYPWLRCELAPHLGSDGALFALLDERLHDALEGGRPLPCDTCQYRVPIAGLRERVGGLQALLWSVRHSFTHTQAMPHEHAHRTLRKHVLVCGNADCAERGSVALIVALRRLLREAGRELDVRITRTHCMGRCGEGPTLAVYPDGIWYRGVREDDAAELVQQHLLGDRLVGRLVDQIMQ